MSAYTKTNLMAIENSAGEHSHNVEARFARKLLDSEHLGVSHFRYRAGFRSPMGHHHGTQEEVYIVVGGSGRMKLDDEIIDLAKWDTVRVAPTTTRALEGGPDGLEVIVVGSDRPEGGDGTPVVDWWTD